MRKKNLFLLALGYLGGIAVAMKFSKKGAAETKKSVNENTSFFDVFVDNVVNMHKDIYKHFEKKALSEENLKLLEEYKAKARNEVENFRIDAEKKIEELKDKGIKKKEDIEKELIALYEKRQKYFDKAKEASEDYMEEGMDAAKVYIQEGRKRLDKAFEEMKKKILK